MSKSKSNNIKGNININNIDNSLDVDFSKEGNLGNYFGKNLLCVQQLFDGRVPKNYRICGAYSTTPAIFSKSCGIYSTTHPTICRSCGVYSTIF